MKWLFVALALALPLILYVLRWRRDRERIRALYDERFCRMWEFYLAGSEVAFRQQGHLVFQMQLAKTMGAVPMTRDYMVDWERSHRVPVADERAA